MRIAILIAAVCCVAIPINGQQTGAHPDAHQKPASKSQPPKNETINVDTVNINKLNVQQQTNPPNNPDRNAEKPPSYLRRLVAAENLPNLILWVISIAGIIVAICTLRIIKRQTRATELAAEATRDSVLLQETAMQQWLEIRNWSMNYVLDVATGAVVLEVPFDAVNPTNLPLTLISTKMQYKGRVERMVLHNIVVAPNAPYSMRLPDIRMTSEEQGRLQYGIVFRIFGCITYRNCFEKTKEQVFIGSLTFKGNGVIFKAEWEPDNPYLPEQTKTPNPN